MKRTACILLTVLSVGAGVRGSVAAQSSGPAMEIEAGFDGRCRPTAWCPVRVILTNEGTDVEGELRVVLPMDGGTDSNVYSHPVVLPAHSRKAYFLYLPATGISYHSRLTVQLIAGNETLVSESATVLAADAKDRLYGVVSRDPSALNFLSDVAPATGRAIVARLSLDTLPPDPLGWEALDVLILNDVDTTGFSDEQRRALEIWVAHGGHLIVGGGVGAARMLAGLSSSTTGQRLLPVAMTGLRQVDDLRALGEEIGATVSAGPFVVAEASLQEGMALIEQGDLVLLARRPYGAGQVDFLAFDAGLNPFTRWDDNARLWKRIVEKRSTGALPFTVSEAYLAQQAVNAIPGLKFLSVLEILAFLLVYIALIGPVNYLVLRKFKRRELAWLTIPLIVLGFTVFAYVTGFNVRGGTAIVHRLGVVYVPRGMARGRVSEMVGLFSPRRTRYDVHAPVAGIRSLSGSDYYYYYEAPAAQPLHVVEDGEGATVTGLRVDVGGIQPFLVEGYADVLPVEADLRLTGDTANRLRLTGTVRSGLSLKDAILLAGDSEQRLGDVEAGQSVPVDLTFRRTPATEGLAERIMGPGDYWQDRELFRRYRFLQACFPYYTGALLPPGVFLVGWAEDVPLPVQVVGRPSSEMALGLYIYEVPVAELETGVNVLIPPTLITRQVQDSAGRVDVAADGSFYMEAGTEVTFRFTVWPGMMLSRVDELVLELRGISYGSIPGAPDVSLWDWASGDWREQDIGWGRHSIADAARYVSRAGEVFVRLKAMDGLSASVQILTISLRGQR